MNPSVPPAPPSTWNFAINNSGPGNGVLTSLNLIGNQLYAADATYQALITFNDLAVTPVTTTAPANNATNVTSNNIAFTWNAYSTIPYSVKYDVQVGRDAKFVSTLSILY